MGVAGVRLATPGHYYCWLTDFGGGQPIGLVSEDWLHRRRTAVTGALVARWLARPRASVATIIGAGKIGREFISTLRHAFPLDELRIASRSGNSAAALVAEFAPVDGGPRIVHAQTIEEAVRGSDIVVTITKAVEAFIRPGWLAEGALLLSMGGVPEVEFAVLDEIDRLIVDDIDYALAQGDLHAWVKAGQITKEALTARLDADIGEVCVGARPGRQNDGDRIMAVIQGMAICDLAMAKMVLDRAVAEGNGQVVDL